MKERAKNKLKDFLTMAPPLGVTHLLAFTLTDVAPSMRIVRLSAGPTLSFRIERYSLVKDIINSSRRARSMSTVEYLSPPLVSEIHTFCALQSMLNYESFKLVLASFPPPSPATPPHLTLMMKTFQSLFPPLSPHTLSLSSARRVVLISYNADRGTVDFRHYLITVKPYGISKRIRRVLQGATSKKPTQSHPETGVLDLGNEKDVADFLLRKKGESGPSSDGYESAASSASSVAGDDGDAVDLADDYVGRNNKRGQKRAVKLDEIGPRIELKLIKVAEGVPGREGNVLYHEFGKLISTYFQETILKGISSQKVQGRGQGAKGRACCEREAPQRAAGRTGTERSSEKGGGEGQREGI